MKEEEKGLTVSANDSQSQYMVVNGYPVTLRFAADSDPDIYNKIRSLLLSNFTMDKGKNLCDNTSGQKPVCTLTTEHSQAKIPT